MQKKYAEYINVNGRLMDLSRPRVMGILNLTPDSFYQESRKQTEQEISFRANQILTEGGSIIDVGACSSRPGAACVPVDEEMRRLRNGLTIVFREQPEAVVSVDTFRADVAKMCVEEFGVAIINDISAGEMDKDMFPVVARLGVPYVMMHMKGTPRDMQRCPHYDNILKEILYYFSEKVQRLRDLGAKDLIVDPGFGFGKTLTDNYELLDKLEELAILELPILVGVSRKSMIYNLLGVSPEDALNGTSAVNVIALMKGADILRVHDVKSAVEVVKIVSALNGNTTFENI